MEPPAEKSAMKHSVVGIAVMLVAGAFVAQAQVPRDRTSSPRTTPDPMAAATKPLTPKTAAPPAHKSAAPTSLPKTGSGTAGTNAELSRLERQNSAPKTPKKASSSAPKKVPALNAPDKPTASSDINFKYHQPAPGMKASNPKANTPNSGTTRVTKNH